MSSKAKTTATKENATPALVPNLRFPEFRGAGSWTTEALGSVAKISTAKVGDKTCIPMSITSGVGLVSQMDKFGRIIAGSSYANYLQLKKNDFAYNKSATKEYPEGFIALYTGDELAAVPNSIFTCFRVTGSSPVPQYLNYLFLGNLHGRWLRNFIEVGARAHGSLSINQDDLLALPIPLPSGKSSVREQQKIAECLSSVDELTAGQARKLDALKTHKKGLMQQLFPREGETQPRLRFPEFQNAGEWREEKLDELLHFQDGFSFKSTDFVKSKEDATQVIRITDINNQNTNGDKVYIPSAFLESNKLGKYSVNDGDLLLSLTGAAGFNFFFWDGGGATINQRTAKVTAKKKSNRSLLRLLEPLIHEKINARGEGQNNNLSKEFLSSIVLVIPEPDEQQRIADFLTTFDDLIAAQTQKVAALKTHKQGLMQQLFPSPEEVES
jgi:type I restriction enzyme, S subunit